LHCKKLRVVKYLLVILSVLSFARASAQRIAALSADGVVAHCSSKDTIYIVNFWATWCAPCVGELPEFNALARKYEGMPVKILMVSLDFKEDVPYKLPRFVEMKKLTPEVVWLSDTDPNVFIPKIDNTWQGSIPATVIVHPGKAFKTFIEGTVTVKQVSRIVDRVLAE
jgi:thiol-disulfide isomerase/thioredoxin